MPDFTMVEAWADKPNNIISIMATKKMQKPTPEQVRLFEEKSGLKVIDVENNILQTDDGIMWRPAKNQLELLCASWDGVEILGVGKIPFVPSFWNP